MPERVKKTKCRGGGVRKNFEGGYAAEGEEDEMRGGGITQKNQRRGWGQWKIMSSLGGIKY